MSRGWLFSISVSALFLMSTADKQPALGQEFLACDNVTSRVDLEVIPINNDSHCSGYVGAYLTNRTNYRIICVVGFQREKDGSWNKSMISVRPQQKKEATLAAYGHAIQLVTSNIIAPYKMIRTRIMIVI